jgi:D-glycero-D-manno-heptose 1,7-bisphosphate phosphatase
MIFTQHTHPSIKLLPAVFLDRDGTINVEKKYLYKRSDWQWIEGVPNAIKQLKDAGYRVVVVSNQAGIARGMYRAEDVKILHEFVNAELQKIGTKIDAFYFCSHHPDFADKQPCECRKPSPNMILQAAKSLHIDLEKSWMIGDKIIDIQAGKAAKVKTILVRTGYGDQEKKLLEKRALICDDLPAAVQLILQVRDLPINALPHYGARE